MAKIYVELARILTDAGCSFVRQGRGDHEIWYSPVSRKKFTVDRGSKSHVTANKVLKEAGLGKHF
jgi:hypothetical protein